MLGLADHLGNVRRVRQDVRWQQQIGVESPVPEVIQVWLTRWPFVNWKAVFVLPSEPRSSRREPRNLRCLCRRLPYKLCTQA